MTVSKEKSLHIYCVTKNGTNPAYEGARIGVRRVVEEAGCAITSVFPQSPDDPVEQAALVEQALLQKPDVVLLAPAHPSHLDPQIIKLQEAGIPVVSFVSRSKAMAPKCFVTSDNYALAYEITNFLLAHLGGRGRLIIMEGNPNSETSAPRTNGFEDAIAANPSASIVTRGIGNYQRADAYAEMVKILAAQPEFDGVLVANDFMALGVIQALEEAGHKVPVVSVNAMPDAIAALKKGTLLATAAFDAMKIACASAQAAIRIVRNEQVPVEISLPVSIVTAENCAEYDRPYEERALPTWESAAGGSINA